ncbi:MAG TPA: OsmC family protein [Opitutales bacterium]|nr:OsmC family protein [Opitutales bacterium]
MSTLSAINTQASRFSVTFNATGSTVLTDPPAGHGGEGTAFAPTDLVDAALATCAGATMCAKAKSLGLDFTGMTIDAGHTMADAPRRIGSMELSIVIPATPDERQKKSLLAATRACTVHNSLRADIVVKMTVKWADGSVDVVEK